MTTTRTYELFDIVWDQGSKWTGFDTHAEAEAWLHGSARTGKIVRRTFSIDIPANRLHLYKEGID